LTDKSSKISEDKSKDITITRIFAASTILAIVVSVPAILVAIVTHYIFKTTLIITLLSSVVALFVATGLGYTISKKLTNYLSK
jgi:ABC-type protease/lipase transport system fused ATPase/permease subunit